MESDPYEFDSQTKFVDEPRKRHTLPWETRELAFLKNLYMQGIPLREICDKAQRPKEGVLPKLVQLGLIRRVADGYRYVYRRKVLPDSYKVSLPNHETPAESIAPNAYAEVRDAEKLVKDAVSGITTCQDFSGLEMRAANATTTGRIVPPTPPLQTQPKEPIMKIETKTFINDQDASTYTDDQIFGEIQRAEKRIEELKAIKVQSGKLAKAIDDLQDYVNKLAAYVDAR